MSDEQKKMASGKKHENTEKTLSQFTKVFLGGGGLMTYVCCVFAIKNLSDFLVMRKVFCIFATYFQEGMIACLITKKLNKINR